MNTIYWSVTQRTATLMALALWSVFAFGCGPQERTKNETTAPDSKGETADGPQAANEDDAAAPETEESPADDLAQPDVTLQVVNAEQYADVVAKHGGKVVLVDFWATWCEHCVKQFPHTVQLHNDFGEKGLAVVSVSMNDPEDRPEVLATLKKFGATFENLLAQEDAGTDPMETFGVDGGLPSYHLYDRKGKLRYNLADTDPDKPLSTDDIDARVKELLAEE